MRAHAHLSVYTAELCAEHVHVDVGPNVFRCRADMLGTISQRLIQFCFMSTETIRLIRDGLPDAEIVLLFFYLRCRYGQTESVNKSKRASGKTQVSAA